jgi:5-methylcytosine-specific restriction endonuclease McrA
MTFDRKAYTKAYNKMYNESHKDKRIEYRKDYNETHKKEIAEYHKTYDKMYYEEHKGEVTLQQKRYKHKYQQEKPYIHRAHTRKRRLLHLNVEGSHTYQEFLFLCVLVNWECSYCRCALTLSTVTEDHVIPLTRGGSDDITNILPACKSCNSSKGNKLVEEWLI